MAEKLIVAIDGPSGAGKSTLSKQLAKALDYTNIDTGAMYRSVAWAAVQKHVDSADQEALAELVATLEITFKREGAVEHVFVNGEDVSEASRTPEISLLTAQVSACPQVRSALVAMQRQMGEPGGVVLEGRDIGTVVFPHAQAKFFLSATAQERGRRRYEELLQKGIEVSLEQTVAEVVARDEADSSRACAPLLQADDAIAIDSTRMTIAEVLAQMVAMVKERESALN